MKKEWLLMIGSVSIVLVLALGIIRWYAPQLLGIPLDLQAVQVSKEVPPFYEGIFAEPDQDNYKGNPHLLSDPYVGIRARPMRLESTWTNAPKDILGFRNRTVPIVADVITIGDSQTAGSHTPIDYNWPGSIKRYLSDKSPVVYNMGMGSWGAIQYLYMLKKSAAFRPRVAVVAFYTGNDPIDNLNRAYGSDLWASYRNYKNRPDTAPSVWPLKNEDERPAKFKDGVTTVFTPKARLLSNDRNYPGTTEGYRIMAEAARDMSEIAGDIGVHVIFTIIPTKEMVYADKVKKEGLLIDDDYQALIHDEQQNIAELAQVLMNLPNTTFVDVVQPLQQAALKPLQLYRRSYDGHPVGNGYNIIARTLAPAVLKHLPDRPKEGLALINYPEPGKQVFALIKSNGLGIFANEKVVQANGWSIDPKQIQEYQLRDIASIHNLGVIATVNPERFGPKAFK